MFLLPILYWLAGHRDKKSVQSEVESQYECDKCVLWLLTWDTGEEKGFERYGATNQLAENYPSHQMCNIISTDLVSINSYSKRSSILLYGIWNYKHNMLFPPLFFDGDYARQNLPEYQVFRHKPSGTTNNNYIKRQNACFMYHMIVTLSLLPYYMCPFKSSQIPLMKLSC